MFDRLEDTVNRYEDITAELGNPEVQKAYERTEQSCTTYRNLY